MTIKVIFKIWLLINFGNDVPLAINWKKILIVARFRLFKMFKESKGNKRYSI